MKSKKGFTLLEIIIAMGISIVVLFVIAQFAVLVAQLQTSLRPMLQGNQDVSDALNTMTIELRSVTESQSGSYPIEAASSSSITFYTDANRDGSVERVRYLFASGTLTRGIIQATGTPATYPTSSESTTTVLTGIATSSGMSFYDSNFTGTQAPISGLIDPTTVRMVQIKIVVNAATSSGTFTSAAMFRNLKSN